ncbi:hypothetical protein HDU78_000782 [Chytriomyces hyalinus]|nr:hypothetical protein HDU78_000782 [Chytriomyces hyalinus]
MKYDDRVKDFDVSLMQVSMPLAVDGVSKLAAATRAGLKRKGRKDKLSQEEESSKENSDDDDQDSGMLTCFCPNSSNFCFQVSTFGELEPTELCLRIHELLSSDDVMACHGILDVSGTADEEVFQSNIHTRRFSILPALTFSTDLKKPVRANIRRKFKDRALLPELLPEALRSIEWVFKKIKCRLDEPKCSDIQTHLESLIFKSNAENCYRRTVHQYAANLHKLSKNSKEVATDTLCSNFLSLSLLNSDGSLSWSIEPGELQDRGSKLVRGAATTKSVAGQKLDLRVTLNRVRLEGMISLRAGGLESTKKKVREDRIALAVAMRDNLLQFRSEHRNGDATLLDQMFVYGVQTYENMYNIYGLCCIERDVFGFGLLFSARIPVEAGYDKGLLILEKVFVGISRMEIGLKKMESLAEDVIHAAATMHRQKNRRLTNHFVPDLILGKQAFPMNARQSKKSKK